MRRLTLLLGFLLATGTGVGQTIAYTVQVVAVSDQAQAFSLIRELGVDNYPAYATRATTDQGDVVRVRVGGFANRAAALLFAETMPDFPTPGSRPLPALADNVPPGVMPFEPRLLFDTDDADFILLDWGEELAIRFPGGPDQADEYRLLQGGNTVDFTAWQAWPAEDGLSFRYRDLPLWPADTEGIPEDVLELELQTQLEVLAARLQLEPDSLAEAVRYRSGAPVLVILERFNPWLSVEVGQLLAVSVPEDSADVWQGDLIGLETPEPGVSVLLEEPASLPVTPLETAEWSVEFDDPFMLQSMPGVNRSWRAAVGAPLWTDGTYLLARHDGRLLIYDFVARD